MANRKRVFWIAGVALIVAVISVAATLAAGGGGSSGVPGQIDDGAELLSQTTITLEEAIAAAQGVYDGALGEVDIEYYKGTLVFNIDVGDKDVKVDASNGIVLGPVSDDDGDEEGD